MDLNNNILEKIRFSPKLKAYYGKNKIFEIFRDITMMLRRYKPHKLHLPDDVIAHLNTVENENPEIITNVIYSDGAADVETFMEKYSNTFNCPIIYYTKKRTDNDTPIIMGKLRKFLRVNGLDGKQLITMNFPSDRNELLQCKSTGFSPNNVIKLTSKSATKSTTTQKEHTGSLSEVEAYYKDKIMLFNLTNDIEEDCYRFENAINQYHHIPKPDISLRVYMQRIIIFGQIGSGRKTQGQLFAARWHLIFLDFRLILLSYAKRNKSFDDLLSKTETIRKLNPKLMASILLKRIKKSDCLENGWVLVGYPSSIKHLEIMEKHSFIIPNKIVFIHCRQRLCFARLRAKIVKSVDGAYNSQQQFDEEKRYGKLGFLDLFIPCKAIHYITEEINNFRKNRSDILEYYRIAEKDIIHIDGEHSVQTTKTELWGRIEKLNL